MVTKYNNGKKQFSLVMGGRKGESKNAKTL